MELSVPTIIIGTILIIVALLLVLVGWGLLIGLLVMGVRVMMHLVKSIRYEAEYMSDNREAELPDRRESSPEPFKSRAPPVRRDPRVQAQAARTVSRHRRVDRMTSSDRRVGATYLIVVIALVLLFILFLFVSPFVFS